MPHRTHACTNSLYVYSIINFYQRLPYFGTLKETGREEDRKTAGEDQ